MLIGVLLYDDIVCYVLVRAIFERNRGNVEWVAWNKEPTSATCLLLGRG
jgi:hypothetical protein